MDKKEELKKLIEEINDRRYRLMQQMKNEIIKFLEKCNLKQIKVIYAFVKNYVEDGHGL